MERPDRHKNDPLVDEYRRRFQSQEFSYKTGAWEAFVEHRDKQNRHRTHRLWIYRMAAVVVLVLLCWSSDTDSYRIPAHSLTNSEQKKPYPTQTYAARDNSKPLIHPTVKRKPSAMNTRSDDEPEFGADVVVRSQRTRSVRSLPYGRNESSDKGGVPAAAKTFPVGTRQTVHHPFSSYWKRLVSTRYKAYVASLPERKVVLPLSKNHETARPQTHPSRRTSIGLAIVPQSSYTGQDPATSTLGGGLVTEFPLSRRLNLVTGLTIARQSLALLPDVSITPATVGTRQLTQAAFTWWGADLPVGLQYAVKGQSSREWFVAGGVSSLGTFGQSYAMTYQTRQTIVMTVETVGGVIEERTQEVVRQEEIEGASVSTHQIQLARMLNLSLGLKQRIGPRFQITVEPYFKYPLGRVSAERLRYSNAGVQLRWSFLSTPRP